MKKQLYWKLWDAMNVITGFAVTQSLAFAFLFLSNDKLAAKITQLKITCKMDLVIILGCVVYACGVIFISRWAKMILVKGDNMELEQVDKEIFLHTLKRSTVGRVGVIIIFTLLDLFVLFLSSKTSMPCLQLDFIL